MYICLPNFCQSNNVTDFTFLGGGGFHVSMPRTNSGVCHNCRGKDHFFAECKNKRPGPLCMHGFKKCFVMEKETKNKGRLFLCCSNNCGFWERVINENSSGPSMNPAKNKTVEEMSHSFQSRVRISDDKEVQISVNVTVQTARVSAEGNPKGELLA